MEKILPLKHDIQQRKVTYFAEDVVALIEHVPKDGFTLVQLFGHTDMLGTLAGKEPTDFGSSACDAGQYFRRRRFLV